MRRLAWLVLLGALGCTEANPPAPIARVPETPAMEPVVAEPAVDVEAQARVRELSDWLAGCRVTPDAFVRHKLYTWTRPEQIEELRERRPRLLSRARGGGGEQSLFDLAIADDPHPVARQLRTRSQRARRFAWVTPWPTRMGWEGGDYGDRLIEVTLRQNAWTASFEPRSESRWRVVDSEGQPVPDRDVARHPERVAAVYHVGDGDRAFREVVLVNEAQIERWAYATDAILGRLRSDAEQLRALANHWEGAAPEDVDDFGGWLSQGWLATAAPAPERSLLERYRSCLALGSDAYAATPEHLRAIAAAIGQVPGDEPLEGVGRAPTRRRPRPSPAQQVYCDPTMGCRP